MYAIRSYYDLNLLPDADPLRNGERLDLTCDGKKATVFQRSWMPAQARMTLGVPLHPDRMTRTDWLALPGVGAKLSERIVILYDAERYELEIKGFAAQVIRIDHDPFILKNDYRKNDPLDRPIRIENA